MNINRSFIPQILSLINIRFDKTKSKTLKHENSTLPECVKDKTNRTLINNSRLILAKTNRENESTLNFLYRLNFLTIIDLKNTNKSAFPKITTIKKQNSIKLKQN